jgi:chloride channel 7
MPVSAMESEREGWSGPSPNPSFKSLRKREGGGYLQLPRKTPTAASYGETASHQFDPDESWVWKDHQLKRHSEDKGKWWSFSRVLEMRRWILTLLTGLAIGLCALLIAYFTRLITGYKFAVFNDMIEREKTGGLRKGSAFVFLTLYNMACAALAHLVVWIEPISVGSGIPEVKCFLNGLNINRLVEVRTAVCKAVGIVFSVSAGLPLGKEGPMIHIGSALAAAISQGVKLPSSNSRESTNTESQSLQDFRNDKEKRDFVACGAAAGVAAAFGAPIGGVLFSFEEGASFWTMKLTWRCFFCCLTAVASLYLINSLPNMLGHRDSGAMFSFGEFHSLEGEKANYSMWELAMFLLVGCLGGIVGACFCSGNAWMFHFRNRISCSKAGRFVEVLAATALMTVVSTVLPLLWTKCTPLPVDMKDWTDQEKTLVTQLNPLYCQRGTHYNELASLYLTESDNAIKQLFHFREVGDHSSQETFSSAALFLFTLPYLCICCITSGIAVPAGMFVPSLLGGAGMGRLVGHILHNLDQTSGTFADSGTYALMGAAAITGGITRITISLTMMVLEATGGLQYVLPLMITILAAFMVGNVFTRSLYDQHIHLRHLHYLEEEEGVSSLPEFHDLTISDIMTPQPVCLLPVVRVGDVLDMLRAVQHNSFPIAICTSAPASASACDASPHSSSMDTFRSGAIFGGTISRKVLCTLLKHRAFAPASCDPSTDELFDIQPLDWGTLESVYPNYPRVEDLELSSQDRECWVDLRPYVDRCALTVNEHASVGRAYRMFRTLGLRNLVIVTQENKIAGIATRVDFAALETSNAESVIGRDEGRKADTLDELELTPFTGGRGRGRSDDDRDYQDDEASLLTMHAPMHIGKD